MDHKSLFSKFAEQFLVVFEVKRMKLTPQQVANWKSAFPLLSIKSDAAIERFAQGIQDRCDESDTCDALIKGVRCGKPRKGHGSASHAFMASE